MILFGTVKIRSYEKGLYFRDREFVDVLGPRRYWFLDPLNKVRLHIVSQRDPWLEHPELDAIVKAGALKDDAIVLDLKDTERALVWIDGRFDRVVGAGLYALWTKFRDVKVEVVDARKLRFEHESLEVILKSTDVAKVLNGFTVEEGHVGVSYENAAYVETLAPGRYATWMNAGKTKLYHIDTREKVLDVAGQDIMTADKVTLRLNAVITYRVADARKSVETVSDADQALYREAQLALRAEIGTHELDALLADKDAAARAVDAVVRRRAAEYGVEVIGFGIRDIILPGDMKELMNKVIEARKAAESNLITRREETAAMRSQLNTARMLEGSPTLMRLRELEILEKVAEHSKLNVVLGEKGLADRVMNLL